MWMRTCGARAAAVAVWKIDQRARWSFSSYQSAGDDNELVCWIAATPWTDRRRGPRAVPAIRRPCSATSRLPSSREASSSRSRASIRRHERTSNTHARGKGTTMIQRELGRSGLKVSAIGLGCMGMTSSTTPSSRTTTSRSASSTAMSTPAATSSTRPTCRLGPQRNARRQGNQRPSRPCRAGHQVRQRRDSGEFLGIRGDRLRRSAATQASGASAWT